MAWCLFSFTNNTLLPPVFSPRFSSLLFSLLLFSADIVVDYYFYNYAFCKDLGLSSPKVSTFMSLMKEVLLLDTSSSSTSTLPSSYAHFESLLLKHSVERPPMSMCVFTKEDVASIVEHVTNHYFRHFKLYKYAFTDRSIVSIRQVGTFGVGLETGTRGKTLGEALESGIVTWTEEGDEAMMAETDIVGQQ